MNPLPSSRLATRDALARPAVRRAGSRGAWPGARDTREKRQEELLVVEDAHALPGGTGSLFVTSAGWTWSRSCESTSEKVNTEMNDYIFQLTVYMIHA